MTAKLYKVTQIPDLSLSKYQALDESGVEGVLKKHLAFLRQIYRAGLQNDSIIRWLYVYSPEQPKGKRLKIFIVFETSKDNSYIDTIITQSPLSPYFTIKPSDLQLDSFLPHRWQFTASLIKKEKFSQAAKNNSTALYSVNKWEMNENARLYGLLTMMQNVNKPCVYCVSVKPLDLSGVIESPHMLGGAMQALRDILAFRVDRSGGMSSYQKDETADYTLERYKDLAKDIAEKPHFLADIDAYADSIEYAEMLLDAAASEALDEGSHDILAGKGSFGINDIISRDVRPLREQTAPRSYRVPEELAFWPSLFMLKELAPFTALPALYAGENIELPKETAPEYNTSGLYLGQDNYEHNVYLPLENLSKHVFIAGVPGSGKTNTMLHIATELHKLNIPFLIFEPVKQEYRALLNLPEMSDAVIFSPSSGTKFPLHINPFEFPQGMSLSEHIRHLLEVFEGAFYLPPPAPFLLERAIEKVYRDKKWLPEMINRKRLAYPTMQELYDAMEIVLSETDYEGDVKGNMKSIIQVRIGSLISREMGDVFDVERSTFEPEQWLKRSAVIELEAMGSGPANFLTLMLAALIRETLRVNPLVDETQKGRPRHVIFFEEAHNLIGPEASENNAEDTNPKNSATAFIVKMLAEVRALNEAIIIADQLPTVMAPEVIKNTSLKIGHRITAVDDRALLGGTMSADNFQLERMAVFERGQALIVYEGLLKPFEMLLAQWQEDKNLYRSPADDELFAQMYEHDSFRKILAGSRDITFSKFSSAWKRVDLRRKSLADEIEQRNTLAQLVIKQKEDFIRTYGQERFETGGDSADPVEILRQKIFDGSKDFTKQSAVIAEKYRSVMSSYIEILLRMKAYAHNNPAFVDDIRNFAGVYIKAREDYIDEMQSYGFASELEDILHESWHLWD